jgi:hypothetical protein
MQRWCCVLGVACMLILLAACGPGGRRQDQPDVAAAIELVAEEELRIGSVDDPDLGFSRVGGIVVDPDGVMYVLESQDRQVRVYDPDGRRLQTFGGQGDGPGEFRNPILIGLRQDTLAVGDMNLGRVTLFSRSGDVLQTLPMPPLWLQPASGIQVMASPVRFRGDGFATTIVRTLTTQETPSDSFWVPQLMLDRAGQIVDTLRVERWSLFRPRVTVGNVVVSVPPGPSTAPLYIDGPNDTYVVERPVATAPNQGRFTVRRMSAAADTVYDREIRYRPLPFTAEEVDSIVAQAVRPHLRNQAADSGAIAAAVRRGLRLPAYQPPVAGGRVGADEVLWLRLNDADAERYQWILIGADGRLMGRVFLPAGVTIHWSSGDSVLAAVRDELDVPWLVRYRLRRVGES